MFVYEAPMQRGKNTPCRFPNGGGFLMIRGCSSGILHVAYLPGPIWHQENLAQRSPLSPDKKWAICKAPTGHVQWKENKRRDERSSTGGGRVSCEGHRGMPTERLRKCKAVIM